MFAVMKPVGSCEGYVRRFDTTSWCRSGKLHRDVEVAKKMAKRVWGRVMLVDGQNARVIEDFSLGAIIDRARKR